MKESDRLEEYVKDFELGWQRILSFTIRPYFHRVETNSEESLDERSIPHDQYFESYKIIFAMCSRKPPHNHCKKLYHNHSGLLENYCEETVVPRLSKSEHGEEKEFLRDWVASWTKYKRIVGGLQRVFVYLERFYVEYRNLTKLSRRGNEVFREKVCAQFEPKVRGVVLRSVGDMRKGSGDVDCGLIKNCLKVLLELGSGLDENVYAKFQEELLINSKSFFVKCAKELIDANCSFKDFADNTKILYDLEKQRATEALLDSSVEPLLNTLIEVMMDAHYMKYMHENEFFLMDLFSSEELEVLSDTYLLYNKQQNSQRGIHCMGRALGHYTTLRLEALLDQKSTDEQDKNDNKRFKEVLKSRNTLEKTKEVVIGVVRVLKKSLKLIELVFKGEPGLKETVLKSVRAFLNGRREISLTLAALLNNALVSEKNDYNENKFDEMIGGFEEELEDIVSLCAYIKEKNLFEKVFSLLLVERTLNRNIKSGRVEEIVFEDLFTKCQMDWKVKRKTLQKDIESSAKLKNSWQNECSENSFLSVNICSSGLVSNLPSAQFPVPKSLSRATDSFQRFFKKNRVKRTLEWRFDLGRADVRISFEPGVHRTFNVTTIQMLILILFEGPRKTISFDQISVETGVPEKLLRFHLRFLCSPKTQVLRKVRCPSNDCPMVGEEFYCLSQSFNGELPSFALGQAPTKVPPFYRERFDLFCKEEPAICKNESEPSAPENISKPGTSFENFSDFGDAKSLRSELQESLFDAENDDPHAVSLEAVDSALMRVLKRRKELGEAQLYAEAAQELAKLKDVSVSRVTISERLKWLLEMDYATYDPKTCCVKYLP